MATIGTIQILIAAGTSQLSKGIASSTNQLKGFLGNLKGMGGNIGQGFGGIVPALGSITAATGPVGIGLMVVAAAATAAIAACVGLAAVGWSLAQAQMPVIDANAKLADRFGITTESLAGLQHASGLAGVSSEELTGGMEKMLKTLGEAAGGSKEAREALSGLGLSYQDLMNQSPDQTFSQIADKISAIENPILRAKAAVDIFGKSGQSLLPLLTSGSAGIAAASEQAEKLGLALSRADSAKVEGANDALETMWKILQGIGNGIAVELAPFLEVIATKITEFATQGEGVLPKVKYGFRVVAFAAAALGDTIITIGGYWWEYLQKPFNKTMQYIVSKLADLFSLLGQAESKVLGTNYLGGVADAAKEIVKNSEMGDAMTDGILKSLNENTLTDRLGSFFNEVDAKTIDAQAQFNKSGKGLGQSFTDGMDEAMKKAQEKIGSVLADLQKEFETFGMNGNQKKLFDMQQLGASPEQMAQAEELIAKLEALDASQKLADEAKKLTESLRTPEEVFGDTVSHLDEMFEASAISQETYARGIEKAWDDMEKGADKTQKMKLDKATGPSVVERRFSFDLPKQATVADPMERVAKSNEKQLEKQSAMATYLKKIEKKMDDDISLF
jgi:hypothetical protein